MLAALLGQAVPAAAAAPPTASPSAAVAQPGAGAAQEAAPDAAASAQKPAPAAGGGPKAVPTADPKAERDRAVRQLQEADPSGACPASLTPGEVALCTVQAYQTVSFSLTLAAAKDVLLTRVVSAGGDVYPSLTAPDGTAVTCDNPLGTGWGNALLRCATSQAGTYSFQVRNGGQTGDLSVSYLPLLSTTACRTVGAAELALGSPALTSSSLPLGSAGDCYTPTELVTDDVLRTHVSAYQIIQVVYDATGKEICNTRSNQNTELDCKLVGPAPFRVTMQQISGAAQGYDLTLARLSRPSGCAVVEPQAFGTAPDPSPVARCRSLRVAAQGTYSFAPVVPVTAETPVPYGTLFRPDGTQIFGACAQGAGCELEPGDYTWAVEARNLTPGAFGMAFHSDRETRGCTATGDNGLVSGPATGTFGGPGQQLCLTLPTATGKGVYLLNRPPADGSSATVTVHDATGARQCQNAAYPSVVCKLTGTAPFRAVLSGTPDKAYAVVVHRTGETAGCTAWPTSGFDGTWGAEVTLTSAVRQACLALPAGQHSTAEMADYTNTQNRLNASLQVVDPQGNVVCSTGPSTAFTCPLAAGTPYTALLVNGQWGDSYKLVRRDISASAKCVTAADTTVGGRSVPLDLNSALDARCVRVTAAATDRFWLSGRTVNNQYQGTVEARVTDAGGTTVCFQWGISCRVTGSTSYTVLVLAAGYQGTAIHADVDTWKVGTAAGWAPECTSHPVSVDGFPARSGVLTASAAGYCAVVDMKPSQAFRIAGTTSATGIGQPFVSISAPDKWDNSDSNHQCTGNYGAFGARCQTTSYASPGKAVLILSADKAATPVEYTIQGVCDFYDCATRPQPSTLSSVTPAAGAAGTQTQAEVRGTRLTLATTLKLARNGTWSSTQPVMKPLSVSPDGTSLRVLVDTNGLEPGSYDVVPDGAGSGTALVNAFTVTPAPAVTKGRFVPVPPSRILNTYWGVGAPAGPIHQGGVLSLKVTGVGGVPATGVSAVVMNVSAVNPTRSSAISVYPSGQTVPDLPTVSFAAGQNATNLVTVAPVNGKVDLRNAWGDVHVGGDIVGYYTDTDAGSGSLLSAVDPSRILNTYWGVGAPAGPLRQGGVIALKVTGVGGVPATGVSAVVMNVSAVNPTKTGYVTVYPNGGALPDVSNINFAAGQNTTNLVTVPVGADGKVNLYNAQGDVHLGADVVGYYSGSGATYTASPLVRLMDTRYGQGVRPGALGGAEDVLSLKVTGVEGVPATGVTEVLLNVTVVSPTSTSYLTVHPHGSARPDTSSINYRPGEVLSALVMVPVVDGRVSFVNQWGSTQVVADLIGYFSA